MSLAVLPSPAAGFRAGFVSLAAAALLAGCSHLGGPPSHQVHVESIAQVPLQKGSTFVIQSTKGPADEATLMYAETAGLVKAALATKGVVEAPALKHADMLIEIEYAMATPRARAGEKTAGQANPGPLGPVRPPGMGDEDASRLRSPSRGPLEKRLMISAREAKGKGDEPPRTLWRVELSVTDLSNDFRKYLPLLATVAIDEMGADSGNRDVKIDEDNKSAALLRRTK